MEQIQSLPDELRSYWDHYRSHFKTQTRDTSEHAYQYLRGQLTMDKDRHYAGIARQMEGQDGQAMQHFMSNPGGYWRHVEKAGILRAGSPGQYNGRFGKVDECQVSVVLGYANWHIQPWPTLAIVDSDLFLAEKWFTSDFAELRHKLGVPEERGYASKPELGLRMIRRAK